MKKKIRIGYFADGPWSHIALEKIIQNPIIELVFICARYGTADQTLKNKANEVKVDFFTIKDINSVDAISSLVKYAADLYVSMSFNQIFRSEILSIPCMGIINCHAGKLPFYRGRNILNWALINDEKEFGITVHYVDSGIDTGDIILQKVLPITDDDTYGTLLNRAYPACAEVLLEAINMIVGERVKRIRQEEIHPNGMYCTARVQGDEIIKWSQSSREVFNFIRALSAPGPEATSFLNGEQIKIKEALYLPFAPKYIGIPGAIIGFEGDGFLVKTLDTFVKVTQWSCNSRPKVGDRM